MSAKKILIVCSSGAKGGLEINTPRLGVELRKQGWEVHFFTSAGTHYINNSIHTEQFNYFHFGKKRKAFDLPSAWQITSYCNKHRITHVITTLSKDIAVLVWAKLLSSNRLKIVYQQHMQLGVFKRSLIHRIRYAFLDAWISPLAYLQQQAAERTNIPISKIHVIPLGIDIDDFDTYTLPKTTAKAQLHLPQDVPTIGIIGRIDHSKGQLEVIAAFEHAVQNGLVAQLIIVGNKTEVIQDGYYEKVVAAANASSVKNSIHFIPHQAHIAPILSALDILIVASRNETYGMVTIEGMLAGVPVIGSNTGGTPDLLAHGELGYLYPLGDTVALANLLKIVIEAPDSVKTNRAKQKIVAEYAAHTATIELEKLLLSL